MAQKTRKKPHNPYGYTIGGSHDRYEETTDGFRFETFRTYNAANNRKARLRRAIDENEPYMWQVIDENHKINYFHTYSDAMNFLGQNGYLPKPKKQYDFYM